MNLRVLFLEYILQPIPDCLNRAQVWRKWRPKDWMDPMFLKLLMRILWSMTRSIILLKLKTWMCLKIVADLRNYSFREWVLIDCSPSLFPEYTNASAIFSTYTSSKHPSNLSLISLSDTVRMIYFQKSNLSCNSFFSVSFWLCPSLIASKNIIPLCLSIQMFSRPL